MNILLLEDYPEIKREYLKYLEKKHKIYDLSDSFKKENIDIIVVRTKTIVDKSLIDSFKNLKYIWRVGIWIDNIDMNYCKEKWIKVLNTPWANANSVSELVIAWVLNLSRKLYLWFLWKEKRFDYMWFELYVKKVWIFWFWNIWKKVYEKLKAFWVKQFFIYDPFLTKEDVEKNEFCTYIEDKNYICANTNIISLHIPLSEQTKNFIWEEQIKLFPNDMIIINTSRGWIINESNLINFLKNNKNAWYFADVWEEEQQGKNPKKDLLNLPNVIITPHIWALTVQVEKKMHYFKELI